MPKQGVMDILATILHLTMSGTIFTKIIKIIMITRPRLGLGRWIVEKVNLGGCPKDELLHILFLSDQVYLGSDL